MIEMLEVVSDKVYRGLVRAVHKYYRDQDV